MAPGLPTVGIWRVSGGGEWSIVLKLLRYPGDSTAQWAARLAADDPYYWKREALVLRTGLLAGSTDVRMPTCHGVVERLDGSVAVWMEDVTGTSAEHWKPDRYREFARQLGRTQGRLSGARLPTDSWLSRGYLRTYVERRRDQTRLDRIEGRHPSVGAARELWNGGESYLRIVEDVPLTLCHLDLHPRNLFDGEGESVLIDWAFAGLGGFGEDIGTLVVDALADFHLAPELIHELFEQLVDGYATGLAETGWTGGHLAVRRACVAGAAARYFWVPAALVTVLAEERPTINGRPTAEALPYWRAASDFLFEISAELR